MEKVMLKSVLPNDDNVQALIDKLNNYQIGLYGLEKCNLESPDEMIRNNAFMVGAFVQTALVGIGSIKVKREYAEIKRMYIDKPYRGIGIAEEIINSLEQHAKNSGAKNICLETGNKHFAAMKFYNRLGYRQIEQFGDYKPNDVSVYYEKRI